MQRRVALLGPLSGALLCAGAIAAIGAGCRHDRPEDPPPIEVPDVPPPSDAEVKAPEPTVLVDGKDVPADLSCLGMPRDAGTILDSSSTTDGVGGGGDDVLGVDVPFDFGGDGTSDVATDSEVGDAIGGGDSAVPTGTLVEKDIELVAFGTGGADKLANQTVDVYWHNTFTRAPDIAGLKSDAKGMLRVKVPEGLRVGYHVRASSLLDDYYGLDDTHVPIPPVTVVRWQGVTKERFGTLALAVTGEKDYKLPPGTGIVAGRVLDCQRRNIQYASIELRDMTDGGAGKPLTFQKCGSGLCLVYLSDNELPNAGFTWTSRSALFAIVDVPANRKLRAVAVGTGPDGKRREIGHRDLEVKANAIVTQYIEPNNPIK